MDDLPHQRDDSCLNYLDVATSRIHNASRLHISNPRQALYILLELEHIYREAKLSTTCVLDVVAINRTEKLGVPRFYPDRVLCIVSPSINIRVHASCLKMTKQWSLNLNLQLHAPSRFFLSTNFICLLLRKSHPFGCTIYKVFTRPSRSWRMAIDGAYTTCLSHTEEQGRMMRQSTKCLILYSFSQTNNGFWPRHLFYHSFIRCWNSCMIGNHGKDRRYKATRHCLKQIHITIVCKQDVAW